MIKTLLLVLLLILLAAPMRADDKIDAKAHQVVQQWIVEKNPAFPKI
jgi:hypothetical protein